MFRPEIPPGRLGDPDSDLDPWKVSPFPRLPLTSRSQKADGFRGRGPRVGTMSQLAKMAIVCLTAVVAVSVYAATILVLPAPPSFTCACPSDWGLGNRTLVPAGSPGCQDLLGEVCYSIELYSEIDGLHFSDLGFLLTSPCDDCSNLYGNGNVTLGSNAGVTVLNTSSFVLAHWNWSLRSWSSGGSVGVPTGTTVLIFDSALQDVSVVGDTFWVQIDSATIGGGPFY